VDLVSGPSRRALRVGPDDAGKRLDIFIATSLPEFSRSRVQTLIRAGNVHVDGRAPRTGERTRAGSVVELEVPALVASGLRPEDIPLRVVYEDDALIVIDKPAGMVVHPGAGSSRGTLVHALLHHCRELSGIGGELRPGIVHRIDRGTSGLLVAAKSERAHRGLASQFKAHSVDREYVAIAWGRFREPEGRIDRPVGRHPTDRKRMSVASRRGRPAATGYRVEREIGPFSLLRLRLETGGPTRSGSTSPPRGTPSRATRRMGGSPRPEGSEGRPRASWPGPSGPWGGPRCSRRSWASSTPSGGDDSGSSPPCRRTWPPSWSGSSGARRAHRVKFRDGFPIRQELQKA
jgi:23S rRNA pseudouridine1911/1915/1917 synthase